jgi:hypothetical protein
MPILQRAANTGKEVSTRSALVRALGTDCLAGVGGLELRNVDADYLFERSHGFAGIEPNSGFGDYSRLSCGVGDTQLGRRPGQDQVSREPRSRQRETDLGQSEKRKLFPPQSVSLPPRAGARA